MSSTSTAEDRAPRVSRDPYFDTARLGLIVLVVLGHSLAYLKDSNPAAHGLYVWIYFFHMPAFVLITGYLSRNFTWDGVGARRTVQSLVVPVVIFELASQLVLRHYTGEPETLNVFATQWLGWFLWAMVVWRVLTPVFQSLRWPLAWALAISLTAPLLPLPNFLAITKVCAFLPFYVAGMSLKRHHFDLLARGSVRIGGAMVLGLGLLAAYSWPTDVSTTVLLAKRAYSDPVLDALSPWPILDRAVLLLVAFMLTAAVLSLVPRRSTPLDLLGTRTLYCYLLHGFGLLVAVEQFGLDEQVPDGLVGVGLVALVGLAYSLLLLTRPVERLFKPILTPPTSWAFKTR